MVKLQEGAIINGQKVFLEWIKTDKPERYTPLTQVYGVIFNKGGKILIARETKDFEWIIPGGRPNEGERLTKTLERELEEEVDVKAKELVPLGVQKVYFPNNPNKKDGELFFQARFIGLLDELLPQTPDPDSGNVWERKFIPFSSVGDYVKWGKTGEMMFKDAYNLFKKNK